MKVIVIEEQNHGVIGVSKNFSSAVKMLIKERWLDEYYETRKGTDIQEEFGENWEDRISSLNEDEFSDFFDVDFVFTEMEIFE